MLSPREHARHEVAGAREAGIMSMSRGAEHSAIISPEESARYADKLRSAIIEHVLAGVCVCMRARERTCVVCVRICACLAAGILV